MTAYEEMLGRALAAEVAGMSARQAVEHLLREGLVSRRGCERLAVRREVGELEKRGVPRCEALEVAARSCCCSYEKARTLFYEKH